MLAGLLGLLVLKMLATTLSVGSNAVGGLFTPSLLIGALLGVALHLPVGDTLLYAAVAMVGSELGTVDGHADGTGDDA